jgi:HSP20 family protein
MAAVLEWGPIRELERLTRSFPRIVGWPFGWGEEKQFPLIESYLRDGALIVRAYVPGFDPAKLEVSVLGNTLTIKGEREEEAEIKPEDYICREVSYGSFERRLTLPEGVDSDKVRAEFKNGVVEVTMPLTKAIAAKKVPLRVLAEKGAAEKGAGRG